MGFNRRDKLTSMETLGCVALCIGLVALFWFLLTLPKQGRITGLQIVPAHTHYSPDYIDHPDGTTSTYWHSEYVPAAFRVHIEAENGRTNYFDVPEGVYRGLSVGQQFDSLNMRLSDDNAR